MTLTTRKHAVIIIVFVQKMTAFTDCIYQMDSVLIRNIHTDDNENNSLSNDQAYITIARKVLMTELMIMKSCGLIKMETKKKLSFKKKIKQFHMRI